MSDRTPDVCAGHVLDGDTADFRTLKASSFWKGPVVFIQANWHSAGLALFDTEAWGDPEVHTSAAAEVLAGAQVLCNSVVPAQRNFLRHLRQRPRAMTML